MMGVEKLRELIDATILSGWVKGTARPVSLLLIAAPESGKTSIVLDKECKSVIAITDATGKGFQNLLVMHKEATHFILTDMLAIMAHGSKVNRYILSTLNAMTEEGISKIATPMGVIDQEFSKKGIIGCLTTYLARDGRSWWNRTGFATRMLPFCYTYKDSLVISIKYHIAYFGEEAKENKTKSLKIPAIKVNVRVDNKHAKEILKMSNRLAKALDEKGIRRTRQLRALAQGHALLRNWRDAAVETQDVEFLRWIEPYISYTEPNEL